MEGQTLPRTHSAAAPLGPVQYSENAFDVSAYEEISPFLYMEIVYRVTLPKLSPVSVDLYGLLSSRA